MIYFCCQPAEGLPQCDGSRSICYNINGYLLPSQQGSHFIMRLRDFIPKYLEYLEKTKAPKTVKSYQPYLLGALAHCVLDKSLKQLHLTDVAQIIEAGKIHGKWGSQRSVSVFRRFCKFIHDSGYKLPFDWRDIELPKPPPSPQFVFTKEELNHFLNSFQWNIENIKKQSHKLMYYSMWALCETLFSTGARISEALSLTLDDWSKIQKDKCITIIGKDQQMGIIYFTDRAINAISNYLEFRNQFSNRSEKLFVNSNGTDLLNVTAKSWLIQYRKHFDYGYKIKFHTFRRTLATMLIYNDVNIKDTQVIMRHKSPRTTIRYYVIADNKHAQIIHRNQVSQFLSTS